MVDMAGVLGVTIMCSGGVGPRRQQFRILVVIQSTKLNSAMPEDRKKLTVNNRGYINGYWYIQIHMIMYITERELCNTMEVQNN